MKRLGIILFLLPVVCCAQITLTPSPRLPNPSPSTLGGVLAVTSSAHQWINAISTSGVPAKSQPAFSDISGTLATATQLDSNTIGIALSQAGADASVSGSPAILGNSITLSLPSASASARGLLTSADWNAFNGKASISGSYSTLNAGGLTNGGGSASFAYNGGTSKWNSSSLAVIGSLSATGSITAGIGGGFSGDGSGITGLNASNISSGTLGIGQIPTGTGSSTVTIGNDARVVNAALAYTEQVITPSSGAVTMDMSNGWQATCVVTQNTTLTLSNLKQGGLYSILFSQTTGGSPFTVTFPTGSLQANGGANVITLSGTNQRDLVYFRATGGTPTVIIEGIAPNVAP